MKRTMILLLIVVFCIAPLLASERINLGCDANGPLAQLRHSEEVKEAFGNINVANLLGSIYDSRKVTYTPGARLMCPLFIDRDAKPSGKLAAAILATEFAAAHNAPAWSTPRKVAAKKVHPTPIAKVEIDRTPQPQPLTEQPKVSVEHGESPVNRTLLLPAAPGATFSVVSGELEEGEAKQTPSGFMLTPSKPQALEVKIEEPGKVTYWKLNITKRYAPPPKDIPSPAPADQTALVVTCLFIFAAGFTWFMSNSNNEPLSLYSSPNGIVSIEDVPAPDRSSSFLNLSRAVENQTPRVEQDPSPQFSRQQTAQATMGATALLLLPNRVVTATAVAPKVSEQNAKKALRRLGSYLRRLELARLPVYLAAYHSGYIDEPKQWHIYVEDPDRLEELKEKILRHFSEFILGIEAVRGHTLRSSELREPGWPKERERDVVHFLRVTFVPQFRK